MRGNSQNERNATYCKKITKEDGFVDFIKESATQIYNKLRAYTPWPGCYFFLNGKRIKIVQARVIEQKISTGEIVLSEEGNIIIGTLQKALLINKLQPESKRVMNASEFVKGLQNKCLTLLAKSSV